MKGIWRTPPKNGKSSIRWPRFSSEATPIVGSGAILKAEPHPTDTRSAYSSGFAHASGLRSGKLENSASIISSPSDLNHAENLVLECDNGGYMATVAQEFVLQVIQRGQTQRQGRCRHEKWKRPRGQMAPRADFQRGAREPNDSPVPNITYESNGSVTALVVPTTS